MKFVDAFIALSLSLSVLALLAMGFAGSTGHEFALILARKAMYFW
jgi:hypothetical protein